MTLPYAEGSVFLVPLRNGGYARGVVARARQGGKVLLGYFFGPRLASPEAAEISGLKPAETVLRLRFGDLGLMNGEWPIKGTIPGWERSQWPMPEFVKRDPLRKKKPVLVRYSDVDPACVEAEILLSGEDQLEADLLSGYGSVEIKLTKLLSD
jgi:hypothetical protein